MNDYFDNASFKSLANSSVASSFVHHDVTKRQTDDFSSYGSQISKIYFVEAFDYFVIQNIELLVCR